MENKIKKAEIIISNVKSEKIEENIYNIQSSTIFKSISERMGDSFMIFKNDTKNPKNGQIFNSIHFTPNNIFKANFGNIEKNDIISKTVNFFENASV